jgi:uncharacterized protein YndB with AHSA1/START domain
MSELTSIKIEIEVNIRQTKQKVWDILTDKMDHWWLPDYKALDDSTVILELGAGGRLYEKTESGAEGLWYTVTNIAPNQSLEFVGHLRPEYGGPATSLLKLSLNGNADQTVLNISDALFGQVNEKTKNSIHSGWKHLFEEGLKKYVEESD